MRYFTGSWFHRTLSDSMELSLSSEAAYCAGVEEFSNM
jgi:hypothetical protein